LSGDALQEAIGDDLSVSGVTPKLFLPGLSGLTQGPGFPNLFCLGLLSDRILGADFTASEPLIRRSDEHQPIR
jgi:mycobactin lysine-N-oxygenase